MNQSRSGRPVAATKDTTGALPAARRERPVVRNPRPNSKREPIVKAAMAMFCHYGYDGTSITRIAEEAGVSKAAVIKFFGSKLELFNLCVSRFADEVSAKMNANVSRKGITYERHAFDMVDLFVEYRIPLRLLLSTMMTPSHIERDILPVKLQEMVSLLNVMGDGNGGSLEKNYMLYGMLINYTLGGNEANLRRCVKAMLEAFGDA